MILGGTMDFDLERNGQLSKAIFRLFASYNKPITKNLMDLKVEMLSEMLATLKNDKIESFFKTLPTEFQTMPTDVQIRSRAVVFASGGASGSGDYKYDLTSGYFTPQGYYIPNGTKIDFMRADDDQLNERQKRFRNAFKENKLPSDYLKEFATMREIEFDYPRGIIQKHRNQWGLKDYEQSGIDAPDYVTF